MVLKRLEKKLGWQQDASPNPDDWEIIRTNWEQDKRTWDFAADTDYRVRIPRRTAAGRQTQAPAVAANVPDDDLSLSSDEILRWVFGPLVSEILSSFGKAMADLPEGSPVRQVLLVGGFGGSPYLQHRVEEHLSGSAPVKTLPAPRSAEAVLRGAVHYALDPKSIHARRLQYTYGLEVSNLCRRPGEQHNHRYVRHSFWDGEMEMCDQLLVFAVRGEVVEAGTERNSGPLIANDYKQRSTRFELFASEESDPYFAEG